MEKTFVRDATKILLSATQNDCLHYYLPGPPDWWNHLLVTWLADAAAARTERPKAA